MPAESGVQIRATHGSLVGFFQWILWLFRRGGGSEPDLATPELAKYRGDAEVSASNPTNGEANGHKTTDESEAVLQSRHSTSAVDPTTRNERVELTEEIRSTEQSKPSADESLKTTSEGPVETKRVQAFLERLPEIQAQLLEAETAPNRAFAEFMQKLTPTRMKLRAPLPALRDDYEMMDEMGVHRASKRPEFRRRVGHVVIMLVFVLLEAWINGSFLAVGIEGGLFAGWSSAAGISFFNVVLLGFTFGAMTVRQLNHHRLHHKLLGALLFCAVLAIAYSSNLLVAHYRDALNGPDPDNASAAALTAWLANPINPVKVNGVQSLWLLGLGIAFTIVGIIAGCLFEDPYPGYGRFYLEHAQRQAEYQSLFQKSFDELRDVAEKQESRLTDLADEINKRLNDFLLLKARYATIPDDPDFYAWKRIEEGFPEARVNEVLTELKEKRGKILDEYTSAMRGLEALDPTTKGES